MDRPAPGFPGITETFRLDHIVTGYYSIDRVNPNRIVPKVPELNLTRPHDRARISASAA
jgi:putative glutathione S-transferase